MLLSDFVSESIKQIIDGVNEAKRHAQENGATVNPTRWGWNSNNVQAKFDRETGAAIETIEFDVAVTTVEGTSTKGGIGVFVGAVGLGSQGQSNAQNTSASRLKFCVPLVLPCTPPKSEA